MVHALQNFGMLLVTIVAACTAAAAMPEVVQPGQRNLLTRSRTSASPKVSPKPATQSSAFTACLLQNKVQNIARGASRYESWRVRIRNVQYINRFPDHILLPKNEAQLQAAVACLVKFRVPWVVRSGGHSYRGFSSIGCGAVLDLAYLDNISVDSKRRRVTISAGVRLGPLYRALWLQGQLLFPGGNGPTVGASGLLLSGGQGISSRMLGMAVDSVLAARVVLTNGSVVNASSSQNPDLFFAIRGGAGSYGIVASWTLQAHPAPRTVTHLELSFPWSQANVEKVLTLLCAEQPWTWLPQFAYIRLYVTGGRNRTNPLRLVLHYWGGKAQLQAFMAGRPFFQRAKPYTTVLFTEGSYIAAVLRAAELGSRRSAAGRTGSSSGGGTGSRTSSSSSSSSSGNRTSGSGGGSSDGSAGSVSLDDFKDARVLNASNSPLHYSAYVKGQMPQGAVRALAAWAVGDCAAAHVTFLGAAAASRRNGETAYDTHRNESMTISFYSSCAAKAEWIRRIETSFGQYATGTQYLGYIGNVAAGKDPWAVMFGGNAARLKRIRDKYDGARRLRALEDPVCT